MSPHPTLPPGHPAARNSGIDAARYPLAFLVVLVHALLYSPADWAVAVIALCRVAVPFFFVAAGYFLPRSGSVLDAMLRPARRLAPIYLFWLAVYAALIVAKGGSLSPSFVVNGGEAFHLWFLPALGAGLAFVGVSLRLAGMRLTALACAGLAAAGVAGGAWADLLQLGPPERNGLLVAPLLILLGTALARTRITLPLGQAVALLVASYVLLFAEEALIAAATGQPFVSHDFPLAVFPLGVAAMLVAMALPAGARPVAFAARLGGLGLTVYTAHLAFLWFLQPLTGAASVPAVALLALAALAGSTLVAIALQQVPALRWVAGGGARPPRPALTPQRS